MRRLPRVWASLLCFTLVAPGCATTPTGVQRVDPREAYQSRTANVFSQDLPSLETQIVLRRYDLAARFEEEPDAVLEWLHERMLNESDPLDELFALAELSVIRSRQFAHSGGKVFHSLRHPAEDEDLQPDFTLAKNVPARSHAAAAVLYANAFLVKGEDPTGVSTIDPRARTATDIYNIGLASIFVDDTGIIFPRSGDFSLPFGTIRIELDDAELSWGDRRMTGFLPVSMYDVVGLKNRYRQAGIGAAVAVRTEGQDRFVSKNAWAAATLFLRIDNPRQALRDGGPFRGTLEIYSSDEEDTVDINGLDVPLEREPSISLAASLEQSRYWETELTRFLGETFDSSSQDTSLFADAPIQPDRIPVVFVHGTKSSAARWANMINDLRSDRRIRDHFTFLFFQYNSGSPILYSSMLLRRDLKDYAREALTHQNPTCVNDMVVVGHSQGGLLTKLTAIDSESRLWDSAYNRPFEEVRLKPKMRELLREAAFVEPLPFVQRVVFIATPHRGSYLAGPQFVRRLAAYMIRLPRALTELSLELATLRQYQRSDLTSGRLSTSIDHMSPSHHLIKALAEIPVDPDVHVHSIIALPEGQTKETGGDGVVRYKSAHIEEVESELVVASGHSTQANPHTIEEVRRILLEHLSASDCVSVESKRER